VVSSAGIEPLEHRGYRSSAPFDWGAPSPGALELAFAMLAHGTESTPPDLICATFWTEVVACLDRSGFVLAYGDLALWLLTAFCDHEQPLRRRLSLRDMRLAGVLDRLGPVAGSDLDPARLYGLGHLAHEVDRKQAVFEVRALNLHVVG